MSSEEWFELAEAAEILGVHASTLRRWADAGKVACIRTLSGRRRFTHAALEQARREMLQPETIQDLAGQGPQQLESKSLEVARLRSSGLAHDQASWFSHLSEEQRLMFRYGGQRLLGLMMQFIRRGASADALLEEGRRIAGDYGRICCRAGLSIAQTAEAFLYFRRSIIESIQTTSGSGSHNDSDGRQAFLRAIDFFDAMLVATLESYAKLDPSGKIGDDLPGKAL